jgi:O-antigen/teichoic acid export membrane protein
VALGQPLGELLFDNADSGIYLARSAWAMVPLSLSQITSAILNSLGYEKTAMRNYFFGSVGLFLAVWFLPAVIGADAVVVGLGVSTAVAVVLNVNVIKKITQCPSITVLSRIFAFTLIAIPTFAFAYFTHNLLTIPPFFALSITGGLAVLIFGGLSSMFNLIKLPQRTPPPQMQ